MLKMLQNLFSDSTSNVENTPFHNLNLAVCVVFLETARSDGEFSGEEYERIVDILVRRFELSSEEANELIEFATEKRDKSLDLYPFTRKLNENLDRPQKMDILEDVWRIIFADGKLDSHEDYIVHILANLLNLRHSELIQAKLNVIEEFR